VVRHCVRLWQAVLHVPVVLRAESAPASQQPLYRLQTDLEERVKRDTKIWNYSGWTCEKFFQTEQPGGCLAVAEPFYRTCADLGTGHVTCQGRSTVTALLTVERVLSADVEGCC
jgi:hypothetical protein